MTLLSRTISRKSSVALDGTFGKVRHRRVVITLHPNGLILLRPERTRRAETIHLLDVYRARDFLNGPCYRVRVSLQPGRAPPS